MKKNNKVRKTRPYDGLVRQLNKETLVLCNLANFEGFKKALDNRNIEYELGDFYKDGIIVVKK